MADPDLHSRISELIAHEKSLREQLSEGQISRAEEQERLQEVEVELDRLWDLLRQRDAKREFGQDPGDAEERPGGVVEGYLG